ncbi:glutamyl-tRNA reductase [Propioniciclava soli]|uniref:Glutamyl-tRNA reductase n=1 Tax=Propioniciclava soli TaxID=2775081 RepID=A0ABZ3C5B7_9ACTN
MGIQLVAVHHADHGLGAVEAIAQGVPGLGRRLVEATPGIAGALVLSTCNRVEVYLQSDLPLAAVAEAVRRDLTSGPDAPADVALLELADADAIDHLFHVTAGLDSMVVGDREVAAQVRRALLEARTARTASGLLVSVVEQALRTARLVTQRTRLATRGRSVVSVALDLVPRAWQASRVLIVGTGAYAGAVVADLAERGCRDVAVFSHSGRAEAFARSHPGVRAVADPLSGAMVDADVVVACRGSGVPAVLAEEVREAVAARDHRELVLVDLAVGRDVELACADLPGALLLDLETISRHVPDAAHRDVIRARELVRTGVAEALARLRGREMDPAVIALRDTVHDMVADEIDRLPLERGLTREEAAHALRRLAARLVHVPSVRARKAAVEGRSEEYLWALSELWGLEAPTRPVLGNLELDGPAQESARMVAPDTLDEDSCPVTGLRVDDLGGVEEAPRREAM